MKYRIVLKVRYYSTWFDFDDIEAAGEFAKTILTHQVPNEDSEDENFVSIEVINEESDEEEVES